MSHLHVKYLLAGGGVAASSAAIAIRRVDPLSPILMVGQEANRPYDRSSLSKDFLRRVIRHQDLFTVPDDWFARQNVELRTSRRVSSLNTARRSVILDNGKEVSYDRLLLATGAASIRLTIPGSSLPSHFYVRTLEDVERLGHAIDVARLEGHAHARGRGKIVVIGGGVLGVELSSTLTQMGLAVHLIVGPPHPWFHFAGESVGRYITRYLQNHGVEVSNSCRAVGLFGDGRVQGVKVDDGRSLPCDFAVTSVGSIANRELLRNTPLTAEKAILVNTRCQTSDPHIFAAGDCAAIYDPLFAKYRIIDNWRHAKVTGEIAGTNMAGGNACFQTVSQYTTQMFDLTSTVFGDPKQVDRRIVRGSTAGSGASLLEIGIDREGRLAAMLALGTGHDLPALEQLIANRLRVDAIEDHLRDINYPLANLL